MLYDQLDHRERVLVEHRCLDSVRGAVVFLLHIPVMSYRSCRQRRKQSLLGRSRYDRRAKGARPSRATSGVAKEAYYTYTLLD